jgi:hypothetical protein
MNTIDTKIRHTTKLGTNLFAELGFSTEEAARYQAEARLKIEEARKLKTPRIEDIDLKQVDASPANARP